MCFVGFLFVSRGCVEVFYNGEWGIICDDYWGIVEVYVICCMFNYLGVEFVLLNVCFG